MCLIFSAPFYLKKSLPKNKSARLMYISLNVKPLVVGTCHHGMARPQVAVRGTASVMEGSCE